jgi:hypothetical protein
VKYHSFAAVSCPSNQLCIAIDIADWGGSDTSSAVVSNNPTDAHSWNGTTIDEDQDVNGVACPSTQLCIAVDAAGRAIVGTSP